MNSPLALLQELLKQTEEAWRKVATDLHAAAAEKATLDASIRSLTRASSEHPAAVGQLSVGLNLLMPGPRLSVFASRMFRALCSKSQAPSTLSVLAHRTK